MKEQKNIQTRPDLKKDKQSISLLRALFDILCFLTYGRVIKHHLLRPLFDILRFLTGKNNTFFLCGVKK